MPAAADTEPQPDTTPPSPAAAGKTGGKKAAAAEKQAPADAAESAVDETPAPAGTDVDDTGDAAPEPPAPEPGWFRNTALTELTVIPHLYPSKTLAPGEATWLPDDPRNPNLERCDAPAPAADATAANTTGSEQ